MNLAIEFVGTAFSSFINDVRQSKIAKRNKKLVKDYQIGRPNRQKSGRHSVCYCTLWNHFQTRRDDTGNRVQSACSEYQ